MWYGYDRGVPLPGEKPLRLHNARLPTLQHQGRRMPDMPFPEDWIGSGRTIFGEHYLGRYRKDL